ncbi:MAG: hypothetical protein KatS3mg031_0929 [Chitinophagales bacterium]|nr:MAG: hypothetical protein KatS3mg031_0929 [Chitinophagales bacterium]
MKVIKFEIQVDELDDVVREIEMKPDNTFKDLHSLLQKTFGIKGERGASFFISNKRWQKLNEITLGRESRFERSIDGLKTPVDKILNETDRLIYSSDDVPQFTFLMAAQEAEAPVKAQSLPRITRAEGNLPQPAKSKFADHIFQDDYLQQTGEGLDDSDTEDLFEADESEP